MKLIFVLLCFEEGNLSGFVRRTIGKTSNSTKGQSPGTSYRNDHHQFLHMGQQQESHRREYKSSSRFTIGVPVTAHLLLAFNVQTALAVLLDRDLQ